MGQERSGHVGIADVECLRAHALAVKWTERRYGGGTAYAPTQDLVTHVRRVLAEANYSTDVGAQLQALLADLWQELGWCAYDAGDQNLALGHFNSGLSVATVSGNDQVAVIVLNYMSLQASEFGSGRDAVTLAQAALDKARGFGSDRMLSLLGSQMARGYARTGDMAAAHAAYAEAERRYQPHDPGRDPEWVAFWSPAEFQVRMAIGHFALGDHRAAESAAETALNDVDRDRYQRDAASYASWCALARARQGEIDGAAERTVETVRLLDGVASGRITGRLQTLVPVFEANPKVSGVPEALAALQTP
jgi:tetratricopeptide (TPR) repeat protein